MQVKPVNNTVADATGYTGQFRPKPMKDPVPMGEAELIAIFRKNNKMKELMRYCREINPDMNGVVTVVEMDDILRILYDEELYGRDLTDVYEPFCQV